jgi:hypothetical protein
VEEIILWSCNFFELPLTESKRFIDEIVQLVDGQTGADRNEPVKFSQLNDHHIPPRFHAIHQYQINGSSYSAEYGTEELKHLIHPKFAHLEVVLNQPSDHVFQVFRHQEKAVLRVNGKIIGRWGLKDGHYLSGKFSMELINRIYGKTDADWLGVFHASAISRENKSVLFLGDSGSGKSTVCAVLMANGFNLVADDFVPLDYLTREVFSFPAAASIKKNGLNHLIPLHPELTSAHEFAYLNSGKTVRYLPGLQHTDMRKVSFPCKALIFVKYKKCSRVTLEKIRQEIAFRQLVPDSWISPLSGNVTLFLDWFLGLPCYQLTYSNNHKMVLAIEKLFLDDQL